MMAHTTPVYIGLGTNIEPREANLKNALGLIQKRAGRVEKTSSVYRSLPYGFKSDRDFLNMVCMIDCGLSPLGLLDALRDIEQLMGRTRQAHITTDRPIDLDVLVYGVRKYALTALKIPHPGIAKRDFVWVPLKELYRGIADFLEVDTPDLANTEMKIWKAGISIWP